MPCMVDEVAEAFRAQWQCQPAAVALAPGRVNLIGEHIDYEGYGVLPMAIDQACYVAVGWRPSAGGADTTATVAGNDMYIGNVQPERYPSAVLPLQPGADLPADTPSWVQYILAAYKGVAEFASSKAQAVPQHSGILLMVGSSVPPAAGLSSSSALVVATALALLELWGIAAAPNEVAEFTCKCERFVGTQGGGMDQAVSVLAQAGRAMHVEFNPVRAHPVPLPPGAMFVVANSLAPSAKAETASYRFNLRVLECRLAAMLLAHLLSTNSADQAPASQDLDWWQVSILKQVEVPLLHYAADNSSSNVGSAEPADALAGAVAHLLPQSTYTLEQVSNLLNITQQQLLQLLPQRLQEAAAAATQLHLQQRAQHVFTEAHRVLTFRHICEDAQVPVVAKLQQLGDLLNASHSSCSQLYQCSCEELDTLVGVAREAGALGARLTGAGWGGCIVALVPQDKVSAFKKQLIQQYYQPLLAKGVITEQDLSLSVFASAPSAGATIKQIGAQAAAHAGVQAAVAKEPALAN